VAGAVKDRRCSKNVIFEHCSFAYADSETKNQDFWIFFGPILLLAPEPKAAINFRW
jgi:hypothetical protein